MSFEHLTTPDHQLSPQEQFLHESLPAQFNTQTASLREVGLLEPILSSKSDDVAFEMCEGITGMDGRPYPLPTLEEITKHFSQEKYAEKISQGFIKLLIVPFAYPLATIQARYAQALLKHHKAGTLRDRDGKKLDLNTEQPLYFDETFDKSDETGDMIYYPTQFDKENHGGFTKQELLTLTTPGALSRSPFPGFHILLIKPDLTIPREGSAQTTSGRKDLEAGKSSEEYLHTLQTNPQYRYEQGMTLEDSSVLALTNLHETNIVLDDWQNENEKDSSDSIIGSYHKASNRVGAADWRREHRQAYVGGGDPDYSGDVYGLRPAVG